MAKPTNRSYSRSTESAMQLLAGLIRETRLERKMTAQEVADRAGISRGLLQRIEKGDLRCEIGTVFEVALVVGVPLFGTEDAAELVVRLVQTRARLALLPKSIRTPARQVKDDF
jgi:transcriptional regulator with XRE-family HTH domain